MAGGLEGAVQFNVAPLEVTADEINAVGSAQAGTFSITISSTKMLLPYAEVALREIYPTPFGFPGIKKVYPFHVFTALFRFTDPIKIPPVDPAIVL